MYTDMQNYQQQIHRLKAVQFSTSQAETLMNVIAERQVETLQNLATKQDIADVRTEIADVRTEIADVRAEIADVRRDVTDLRKDVDIKIQQLMVKQDRHLLYTIIAICIAVALNNWESILARIGG